MIERLSLTNFRKFQKFSLTLNRSNILVGPNNCGKSSILDAFRLLDACYRHSRARNPTLLQIEGEGVYDGYELPERLLPFKLSNATYNYNDQDAVIEFWNSQKTRAVIRLNPAHQSRFYIDKNQRRLTTSTAFRKAFSIDLVIVPTLAPIEAEEPLVEDETVQRNERTRLASRVLRNIWLRRTAEEFDSFRREIEVAWPGVELQRPKRVLGNTPFVEMYYSENRIDREVQWAGFGFQVWLQIQTHLRRRKSGSILIIDEPDIYLHSDLQRRLLRDAKSQFEQFVMATHSVEIINDADAKDIVTIHSQSRSGRRVRTEEDYAALYQYIGSTENADLARVARARRVLFVEGEDAKLLRRLASRFNLVGLSDVQLTPIIQLGGVSEWRRATHAVWAFRKILDIEVSAFCLFDRDYRSDAEIKEFLDASKGHDFECAILGRKEIENFLIEPECIRKAAWQKMRHRNAGIEEPRVADVEKWLFDVTENMKNLVMSRRVASVLQFAKEHGSKTNQTTLIERASEQFDTEWKVLTRRLALAPGKDILARLNERLQTDCKIALTQALLVEHLSLNCISVNFMSLLETLNNFCLKSSNR